MTEDALTLPSGVLHMSDHVVSKGSRCDAIYDGSHQLTTVGTSTSQVLGEVKASFLRQRDVGPTCSEARSRDFMSPLKFTDSQYRILAEMSPSSLFPYISVAHLGAHLLLAASRPIDVSVCHLDLGLDPADDQPLALCSFFGALEKPVSVSGIIASCSPVSSVLLSQQRPYSPLCKRIHTIQKAFTFDHHQKSHWPNPQRAFHPPPKPYLRGTLSHTSSRPVSADALANPRDTSKPRPFTMEGAKPDDGDNFFNFAFMHKKAINPETGNREHRLPFIGFLPNKIRNHFVAMMGEFAGTFLFLYFAFSATQVANAAAAGADTENGSLSQVPNASTLLYISLAFGFSLAVNAWVFFRISGE
nr:aquaporin-like protein 2 [Quercus suber]